jgi:hypothetical protein
MSGVYDGKSTSSDDVGMSRTGNKVPGLVVNESLVLVSHGSMPQWIMHGLPKRHRGRRDGGAHHREIQPRWRANRPSCHGRARGKSRGHGRCRGMGSRGRRVHGGSLPCRRSSRLRQRIAQVACRGRVAGGSSTRDRPGFQVVKEEEIQAAQ